MYISKRVIVGVGVILLLLVGLLATQWPQQATAQNREIPVWKLPYNYGGNASPVQFAYTPGGGVAVAYSERQDRGISYIIEYNSANGVPVAVYIIDGGLYPSLQFDTLRKRAK